MRTRTRGFNSSSCLASGRRRLRAVLVARPVGRCVGGGPVVVAVTEIFAHRRRRAVDLSALMVLRGRGELHGERREQGRAENGQDRLSHLESPYAAALLPTKIVSPSHR